jgi:protein SCO1
MRPGARPLAAVASLAAIAVITAAWWMLALWPVDTSGPEWVLRTRLVCFGAASDRLPNAAGWIVLIGQPAGMLAFLFSVWGADLRRGLRAVTARVVGQLAVGIALALVVTGAGAVVVRVRTAGLEPFDTNPSTVALTRIDDAAPAIALVDQNGRGVTLDTFRGEPVLITFAYAHCETVCPATVSQVRAARGRLGPNAPALLIVTLDPWRDTPTRLPAIAQGWALTNGEHVLSGESADVERILNAWRVPRARNEQTGAISHPSLVYVIGADGRIHYAVEGSEAMISAAVRAL